MDCEFLKRCCESLTEENRRLQRELQELRALKFAPPGPGPPPPPAAAVKADPGRPKAAAPAHHFFNPFTHSAAC